MRLGSHGVILDGFKQEKMKKKTLMARETTPSFIANAKFPFCFLNPSPSETAD